MTMRIKLTPRTIKELAEFIEGQDDAAFNELIDHLIKPRIKDAHWWMPRGKGGFRIEVGLSPDHERLDVTIPFRQLLRQFIESACDGGPREELVAMQEELKRAQAMVEKGIKCWDGPEP